MLSLFSGIGGFERALAINSFNRPGVLVLSFESSPICQAILELVSIEPATSVVSMASDSSGLAGMPHHVCLSGFLPCPIALPPVSAHCPYSPSHALLPHPLFHLVFSVFPMFSLSPSPLSLSPFLHSKPPQARSLLSPMIPELSYVSWYDTTLVHVIGS